jgi:hypothetical protein
LAVRELQLFGRTRDEMIMNLGRLVESNPCLKDEYMRLITSLAENYDSVPNTTLAEEFGIQLERDTSLEQRVKQIDRRLLRLMIAGRKPKSP